MACVLGQGCVKVGCCHPVCGNQRHSPLAKVMPQYKILYDTKILDWNA